MSVFRNLAIRGGGGGCLLILAFTVSAQQAADTPTRQLQQLLDVQQAAKSTGDPATVAASSEKLSTLATQQMSMVTAARKQPGLSATKTAQLQVREQQLRQILSTSFNDWGTAEARQQQYQPALAHFQQAEKWDAATPGVMRNLGTAAFRLEDYAESARALQSVVAANPEDQRSRLMLAMSLFTIEKFPEAANQFAPIGDLAMQDPRSAFAWAYSLSQTSQQQHANEIADNLAGRDLPPDVHLLVCKLYTATENYEHALPCLRTISAQNPAMLNIHYETGATLIHMGRPTEAIPELRAELSLNSDDVDAKYNLAYALLETSGRAEALTILRSVIVESPKYSEAEYQLGKALLEDGNVAESIPYLETATKLDPAYDYAHYQLQLAYRRAGRTDDANRELQIYKEIKAGSRNKGGAHDSKAP